MELPPLNVHYILIKNSGRILSDLNIRFNYILQLIISIEKFKFIDGWNSLENLIFHRKFPAEFYKLYWIRLAIKSNETCAFLTLKNFRVFFLLEQSFFRNFF
jgi:hypothetical protein